jgi:hypothetical protein
MSARLSSLPFAYATLWNGNILSVAARLVLRRCPFSLAIEPRVSDSQLDHKLAAATRLRLAHNVAAMPHCDLAHETTKPSAVACPETMRRISPACLRMASRVSDSGLIQLTKAESRRCERFWVVGLPALNAVVTCMIRYLSGPVGAPDRLVSGPERGESENFLNFRSLHI